MADFKKHMMHGDGKGVMANTPEEHSKLEKKGWGHEKPSGLNYGAAYTLSLIHI